MVEQKKQQQKNTVTDPLQLYRFVSLISESNLNACGASEVDIGKKSFPADLKLLAVV